MLAIQANECNLIEQTEGLSKNKKKETDPLDEGGFFAVFAEHLENQSHHVEKKPFLTEEQLQNLSNNEQSHGFVTKESFLIEEQLQGLIDSKLSQGVFEGQLQGLTDSKLSQGVFEGQLQGLSDSKLSQGVFEGQLQGLSDSKLSQGVFEGQLQGLSDSKLSQGVFEGQLHGLLDSKLSQNNFGKVEIGNPNLHNIEEKSFLNLKQSQNLSNDKQPQDILEQFALNGSKLQYEAMGKDALSVIVDKNINPISKISKFAKGNQADKINGIGLETSILRQSSKIGIPQEISTIPTILGNNFNATDMEDGKLLESKIELLTKNIKQEIPFQERSTEGFANIRDFKNTMESRVSIEKNKQEAVVNELTTNVEGKERAIDGTTLKSTAKNIPVYVVKQVGYQVAKSFNLGENELRFHLKPASMGRLQMSIDNSSDGLKVTIIAEHQATKDMLLANSNELRATLAEQGLKLDSIDIKFSSNYDQAMEDSKQDMQNSKGNKKKSMGVNNRLVENPSVETVTNRKIVSGHSLNLVV